MTGIAEHFDEFGPHTRLKHLILKADLSSWAFKMLLRDGAGDRAYFIDACAGAGMDQVGNHGSPVLAAREAAIARTRVRAMTGRDVDVITIAVERKASEFRELKANLAPFAPHARALRGELKSLLTGLLDEAGESPILCFIDPFGVEGLRADVGEDAQQLLIDPAAAVEALIDDERLLGPVRGEVELELAQRRRVHRADVQVADLAVARLAHHLAAIVDPARVLQIGERRSGDQP